jgi:hypothetical protein
MEKPAPQNPGQPTTKGWFEEPLTPREYVLAGALRGAIVGGMAGALGGGVLDLDALGKQLLVGAGLGFVIGVVFGLLSRGGRFSVLKGLALWVPFGTVFCAAIFGTNHLVGWAFGRAINQWVQGLRAGLAGAVLGSAFGALFVFLYQRFGTKDGQKPPKSHVTGVV